jgi:hypothetical protein
MGTIFSYIFSGRVLVLAVTLLGACAHGYYSNRWHQSDEQRQRAGRILEEFRQDFGDWTLRADVPFVEDEEAILLFSGAINRSYVNRATGDVLSVAVIVGPPGQTSTHTAALCYGSRGYDSESPIELVDVEIAGRTHQIAQSRLRPVSAGLRPLEVCYAWRQDDQWLVPAVPRVAFGGGEYLFKVQAAASLADGDSQQGNSICLGFLREFLGAMETQVFDRLNENVSLSGETVAR